jgi:hypothetical protein
MKTGRICEISRLELRRAYEDIKAPERGNCEECLGRKELGLGVLLTSAMLLGVENGVLVGAIVRW